jgi:Asp/Glu/hydantoin racemase
VRQRAAGLLDAFVAGGRELVALGADGITTNCGFLSVFQSELAAAVGVPVAASSLMQAPLIERLLSPGRRVGILAISRVTLTPGHLMAAGVPADTPVAGTEGGQELSRAILGDELEFDVAACERDVLDAVDALLRAHPEVGALLLECTNMCPYAQALHGHTGLPVFDMVSFITWFHAGLAPRRF